MLHENTVTKTCLAIIKKLMTIPELTSFRLAGGTALSLKYGHRTSEDIDLFSEIDFESDRLKNILETSFDQSMITNWRPLTFGVFCNLDGIKSDFMCWNDPFIMPADTKDTIRFASDQDIFAMKLNAAFDRKSKKDFIDIALLIDQYGLTQGINWYKQKFPYNDEVIPLKYLTDFDTADEQPDPELFLHYTWRASKETLIKAVREIVAE